MVDNLQSNIRRWMTVVESRWDKADREPHHLAFWGHDRYPWGPLPGDNQRTSEIKLNAIKYAERHATVETVHYPDLVAIEHSVYPARVQHYIDHPDADLPFVYRHNGKLVLWDGTHRVEAALRRGVEDGPARVADFDSILDQEGRVRDPERWR
jgi:hypothetical protein